MPVEVEIGTLGRKVDSRGVAKEFTPEFFAEVAESYNPSNFKAPAIISHDTKGIPDDKLHKNKELSYGAVSAVKFAGDRLKVVFDKLSPKIKEYFENGELLSVSPSFYPPQHHSNPTPGQWSLRHLSFLGSSPPAIKGMAAPQFSEKGFNPSDDTLNFSFPVDLNEDGETLEFSIGSLSIRSLFSNLRDWLIEKHGVEETEKILPGDAIAEISMSDRYQQEEINGLRREINELRNLVHKPQVEVKPALYAEEVDDSPDEENDQETPVDLKEHKGKTMKTKHKNSKPPVDDFEMETAGAVRQQSWRRSPDREDELEEGMEDATEDAVSEENKKKKKKKMDYAEEDSFNYAEELAEERRQKQLLEIRIQAVERKAEADRARQREKDITSFCEGLVKDGQLTAAQMGDRLLEFGEGEEAQQTLPQFMMTLDDEQLSFMEDFLSTAPQIIEYDEFAPDNEQVDRNGIRDFSAPSGFSVSDDSADLYNRVAEYAEANGLDMTDPDELGKAYDAVSW